MILEQGIRDAVLCPMPGLPPRQHGWLAPYQRSEVGASDLLRFCVLGVPVVKKYLLNSLPSCFTGPDTDNLLHGNNEDLPVSDLTCVGLLRD